MALSTRGRGAYGAPSDVTTSFRPPRFRKDIGMWIVIVSPFGETAALASLLQLPAADNLTRKHP